MGRKVVAHSSSTVRTFVALWMLLFTGIHGCGFALDDVDSEGWILAISRSEAESLLSQVQESLRDPNTLTCRVGRYSATDAQTLAAARNVRPSDILRFGRPPYLFERNAIEIILFDSDTSTKVSIMVVLNGTVVLDRSQCKEFELSRIVQ